MRPLLLAMVAGPLLAASPARAQREDEQVWLHLNVNIPVADRWRVTVESIARFGDQADGHYQSQLGGILNYRVADRVELGVGYRRVEFHGGAEAPDEDRVRQQVVATFGRVATRLWFDQRFRRRGDEVGLRLRPLIRYNHPIGGRRALFASHESFYLPNGTRWGQRRGYDRMRHIVGVTLPLAKAVSADIGYLNEYRLGRGGARGRIDHALMVQVTISAGTARPKLND